MRDSGRKLIGAPDLHPQLGAILFTGEIMSTGPIQTWHRLVAEHDTLGLDDLLADDAVFYSPVVHTPQAGKAITKKYLAAAFRVLFNDSFRYVRELSGQHDAVLEFEVQLDGIAINGVDMIMERSRQNYRVQSNA